MVKRKIAYATVNNTNLYSCSGDTFRSQFVHLRHDVWRKGVVAILALDVPSEIRTPRCACPVHLVLGKIVHPVLPHLLDAGKGIEPPRVILGIE